MATTLRLHCRRPDDSLRRQLYKGEGPGATSGALSQLREQVQRRKVSAVSYSSRTNLVTKVLDFVQIGGPDLTVGSTIFEMWMGL